VRRSPCPLPGRGALAVTAMSYTARFANALDANALERALRLVKVALPLPGAGPA
jgi:hypothetical protein